MRALLLSLPLFLLPLAAQAQKPAVPAKAFVKDLQVRAQRGQAEAMFELAVCYRFGQGVALDEAEALRWYQKSAEKGFDKAQYNLGVCYDFGTGTPVDHEAAARWYHKAAYQGHPKAAYNLGVDYFYGQGVARDDAEAYAWFDLASRLGEVRAEPRRDELAKEFDAWTLQRAQERAMALRVTVHPKPVPAKRAKKP